MQMGLGQGHCTGPPHPPAIDMRDYLCMTVWTERHHSTIGH